VTEADYTRDLLKALRTHLPEALVIKLADVFTMGVPDFFINLAGVTTWFEAKRPEKLTFYNADRAVHSCLAFTYIKPKDHVPAVQWETLRRLGRGYLVVYTRVGHGVVPVVQKRDEVDKIKVELMPMDGLVSKLMELAREERCAG
jgi:hypothetical protein